MKKLMMFMGVIAITLFSCSKDETCNCGTISDDGIDLSTNCYWLEIRNSCSGNKKKFCFDQDVWMNNQVGSDMCVNNEPKW
jgi:hypothetical protein